MLVTLRSCNYHNLPLPALAKKKVTQLHLGGFYMSAKASDRSSQTTKTECCQADRYRPTTFSCTSKRNTEVGRAKNEADYVRASTL